MYLNQQHNDQQTLSVLIVNIDEVDCSKVFLNEPLLWDMYHSQNTYVLFVPPLDCDTVAAE